MPSNKPPKPAPTLRSPSPARTDDDWVAQGPEGLRHLDPKARQPREVMFDKGLRCKRTVYLTPEVDRRFEDYCRAKGVKPSNGVERAIVLFLEKEAS